MWSRPCSVSQAWYVGVAVVSSRAMRRSPASMGASLIEAMRCKARAEVRDGVHVGEHGQRLAGQVCSHGWWAWGGAWGLDLDS